MDRKVISVPFLSRKVGLWLVPAVLSALTSCTLKAPEHQTRIRIDLPKANAVDPLLKKRSSGPQMNAAPAVIGDFQCFGINITGPGIVPPVQAPGSKVGDCLESGTPGVGIFGGLISSSGGGVVEVSVPSGTQRTVQVFGVRSLIGCPTVNAIFSKAVDITQIDNAYELARTTVDMLGDTTLNLQAQYSVALPKPMFCDTRTAFEADATNSSISATGPVVADGSAASTVTVTIRDVSNAGMQGIVPVIASTGSNNNVGTCTVTSALGVSTCTVKSTKAQSKTFSIVAPVSKTGPTITFVHGPADHMSYVTQPGNATSQIAFPSAPQISIVDVNGNLVDTNGPDVTASLTVTLFSGTGTLSGTTTVAAVGGVASFTGLSINLAGTGKVLRVTKPDTSGGGGTTSMTVDSNSFSIMHAAATQIVLVAGQPSNPTTAGTTLSPQVQIRDAAGNPITSGPDHNPSITASLFTGTGPLNGTLTQTASAGAATFGNLSLNVATGASKVIRFTKADTSGSGGTASLSVDTSAFAIQHAAADHLTFAQQPTAGGYNIDTHPIVEIRDAYNNVVTSSSDNVTITIQNNPRSASISGGNPTIAASAGVADFTGVFLTRPGNGITLRATRGGMTVDSSAFNLVGVNLQVPIDIVTRPVGSHTSTSLPFDRTRTSLNTNLYDGTVSYKFEMVAWNQSNATRSVYLVDQAGLTVATLSVPPFTTFGTRFATSFTPNSGADYYRLKMQTTPTNIDLVVTAARILVTQQDASKTALYIPMVAHDPWLGSSSDFTESDVSSTAAYGQPDPMRYPRWKYEATKFNLSSGISWKLEAVLGCSGSGSCGAMLYRTDATAVAGTEVLQPSAGGGPEMVLTSADFSGAGTFTDTSEFEIKIRRGSAGSVYLFKAGIWTVIDQLVNGQVLIPLAQNRPTISADYIAEDQIVQIDTTQFSNAVPFFEVTSQRSAGAGSVARLRSIGVNETLNGAVIGSLVSNTNIPFSGTGKFRNRSTPSFALTAGDRVCLDFQLPGPVHNVTDAKVVMDFGI